MKTNDMKNTKRQGGVPFQSIFFQVGQLINLKDGKEVEILEINIDGFWVGDADANEFFLEN